MYQAPMSLKEIIVNRLRNYFFLNIMQHLKTKIFEPFSYNHEMSSLRPFI